MHSPVARGVGGDVEEGGWGESTRVVRAANQSTATCKGPSVHHTDKHTCARTKTHIWRFTWCKVTEETNPGSREQAMEHFSSVMPRSVIGFIDFRLNGWCRCRAQTTALLWQCNILLSNKHQPGCQHEQLLLFKAVSFKGDELEWLGWRNQVRGLNVVRIIYESWGVDKLNSFVLFTSYGSRLTRKQTTEIVAFYL